MPRSDAPEPSPAGLPAPTNAPVAADGAPTVRAQGRLTEAEVRTVLDLVSSAEEEDGVGPLSEHVMLHLRYGGDPRARNLLLTSHGELVGYAHMDPTDPVEGPSGELVVHPGHRRQGLGLLLTRALVAEAGERPLRLWAHGDLPGAARLAAAAGFERVRALWQMRRSLQSRLDRPQLAEGITVRTFVIGQDEDGWAELNSRAFARHPEQGAWSREDLDLREREPWFDPNGFFLAERGGKLAGFHWTKIHGAGDSPAGAEQGASARAHEPIGEVYVVGVAPDERGTGLGRALTLVGLRYLRSQGLFQVMLYVDESNAPAIGLYESLGFTHWDTDVMFSNSTAASKDDLDPPGPAADARDQPAARDQPEQIEALATGRTPSTRSSSSAVSGRSAAATALSTSAYSSISSSATRSWTRKSRCSRNAPTSIAERIRGNHHPQYGAIPLSRMTHQDHFQNHLVVGITQDPPANPGPHRADSAALARLRPGHAAMPGCPGNVGGSGVGEQLAVVVG